MKIAVTAALARVDAPKMRRNSRSQADWYTSEHAPERKRSGASRAIRRMWFRAGT
jgi:hypothetical protein